MGQEIAFLINERSGQGEARELAEIAREGLPGLRVESTLPRSALELTELCKRLPPQKTKAAVVFGGDGTLNYALRGLLDSEIPLYPYPSGTANDLANENGITRSPEQLGRLMQSGVTREVRVLQVNGIPFSTISGIGIGSKVCDEYNRMRGRFQWIQKLPKRFSCERQSDASILRQVTLWLTTPTSKTKPTCRVSSLSSHVHVPHKQHVLYNVSSGAASGEWSYFECLKLSFISVCLSRYADIETTKKITSNEDNTYNY
jgi:hypothetical protein